MLRKTFSQKICKEINLATKIIKYDLRVWAADLSIRLTSERQLFE